MTAVFTGKIVVHKLKNKYQYELWFFQNFENKCPQILLLPSAQYICMQVHILCSDS